MSPLKNKRVAILAADGYEQSELDSPMGRLKKEGAMVEIISLKLGKIKGMKDHEWTATISVDKKVTEANHSDYDALILPGGVLNPDTLRMDKDAIRFVQDFAKHNKPIAAICHGPQTLIDGELVAGKKMTSVKAIEKDLKNAGAEWVDEAVVEDQGFITSRTPEDLPQFEDKIVEVLSR